jgi:ribosomal protein S17E
MGKIKSRQIRKTARILDSKGIKFSENFDKNKDILRGLNLGKKIRNQIAGLLAKTKKREIVSSAQ